MLTRRGWPVWLLLDEDTSHTAHASVGLARELGIGLIWLPKRCPELNAMDHLWGRAKDEVCANSQAPRSSMSSTVSSAIFKASPRRKLAEKAVYSPRNSGLGKNVKISNR